MDNPDSVLREFEAIRNCPRGKHDLVIGGMDVDVKNTIGSSWMIGPEIYRDEDPCILTKIDDANRRCSLGLIVCRDRYLGGKIVMQKEVFCEWRGQILYG
jgi:hypothetical protein